MNPANTPQISETAARLDTHEAVCAERYKGIETWCENTNARLRSGDKRMARIERALYVLLLMGAAAAGPHFIHVLDLLK